MAQKKPVTFEDLDLHRLPLPLVAALQKLEEETESFRKVHRLIDTVEVFVKLHTVAIVADVFDGEDVEPEVQGMLAAGLRAPIPRGVVDVCSRTCHSAPTSKGGASRWPRGWIGPRIREAPYSSSWKATTT